MSTTPTIILVHGLWGGAAHWSKVIVHLSRMGYTSIHAVENPLTSLADDVERTRKMVAQVSGPVLLVGHSYGGAVITGAGVAPNVVGLVYIAAFAPDAGESLGQIMQAAPPPAGAANVAPDSDGYVWIFNKVIANQARSCAGETFSPCQFVTFGPSSLTGANTTLWFRQYPSILTRAPLLARLIEISQIRRHLIFLGGH